MVVRTVQGKGGAGGVGAVSRSFAPRRACRACSENALHVVYTLLRRIKRYGYITSAKGKRTICSMCIGLDFRLLGVFGTKESEGDANVA